jgi:hypothetical protein
VHPKTLIRGVIVKKIKRQIDKVPSFLYLPIIQVGYYT